MDPSSSMYIAYGSSMKSEREAFGRVVQMLSAIDITIDTVRLDRHDRWRKGIRDTKDQLHPERLLEAEGSDIEFLRNTMAYLANFCTGLWHNVFNFSTL